MKNDYNWTSRIKDEKHFAKTVMARYKMSNTKNKDFVNIVILDYKEIIKFFNYELFVEELKLLDFNIINIDNNYIGVVKNNETREIRLGKLLKINMFL